MGKRRFGIQLAVLLAVLVIGGFTVGQSLFSSNERPKAGDRAPNFTLTGIDQQSYELASFRGKPVIVNFWGTFCEPCKEEMPDFQAQYEKWKDSELVILGVNLNESSVTVQSFVRQNQLTFPILYDVGLRVRDLYKVDRYPTTLFVDPDGKIVDRVERQVDETYIEQAVQRLLAK